MKEKISNRTLLMGNEAIAYGIVENGCILASSYPGTPASEILSSIARIKKHRNINIHVEWSVNEKCAFEIALTASYTGCRSAVAMKQVGLNVALDPLMSAAYTGIIGGFIICSADDPGPYSSQTEQDSRALAMFAKIPVFDPSSPHDAYKQITSAYNLSEKYGIPVMLRPTTRVCHARQDISLSSLKYDYPKAYFKKEPTRWAATPRYRYILHKNLNHKIKQVQKDNKYYPIPMKKTKGRGLGSCIIASGVAFSYAADILNENGFSEKTDLFKVLIPYPLNTDFIKTVLENYRRILIFEETYPVIEIQFPERKNILGRLNGFVPQEGELTPENIEPIIHYFLHQKKARRKTKEHTSGQRPSLCPGCPHRASFFAIKTAHPNALYPGDIGCYTLGINLGAVDTCLCMGASINQATGFFHAFSLTKNNEKPIIAAIGDSTFIHAGIPALINAVYNGARFVLVILDNSTTAMTGNQPTALSGIRADGSKGKELLLEKILEGCGVTFLKCVDPYNIPEMISVLKDAHAFCQKPEGGVSVVIARRPCLIGTTQQRGASPVITDACTGCGFCVKNFECPALSIVDRRCIIDKNLCNGCNVCVHVCPKNAIIKNLSN